MINQILTFHLFNCTCSRNFLPPKHGGKAGRLSLSKINRERANIEFKFRYRDSSRKEGIRLFEIESGIDERTELSASVHSSRRGDVTSARNDCLRGNGGPESRDSAAFHKRIVSQTGSHYANNPRYICEFIIVHNRPDYIHIGFDAVFLFQN